MTGTVAKNLRGIHLYRPQSIWPQTGSYFVKNQSVMLHSTSFTTSDALVLLGGSIGTHLTANRTKFHEWGELGRVWKVRGDVGRIFVMIVGWMIGGSLGEPVRCCGEGRWSWVWLCSSPVGGYVRCWGRLWGGKSLPLLLSENSTLRRLAALQGSQSPFAWRHRSKWTRVCCTRSFRLIQSASITFRTKLMVRWGHWQKLRQVVFVRAMLR